MWEIVVILSTLAPIAFLRATGTVLLRPGQGPAAETQLIPAIVLISTGPAVDGKPLRRYRDYRNAIEPRRARSGPAQHIESGAAAGPITDSRQRRSVLRSGCDARPVCGC